jgi:ribosomal protein L11 methyltransferase
MAFGTGLHATTSYCLEALEKHLAGPNILDVGTGSGILAIAAAFALPEAKITAIDFDENSFDNAQHNFELNHVDCKIKLSQDTLESFEKDNHKQFDTILSNLTAEVIIACLPTYNKILANGGNLILAGIIEERLPLIEKEITKYPLRLIDKNRKDGWVGLTFTKESQCRT